MDIFTDASLNDKEKIAGIGMVFVLPMASTNMQYAHTYLMTDNIETAELFAISEAIAHAHRFQPKTIRLYSDSVGALRKLQRIFHHPDQRQIHTINNSAQKEILYRISTSFEQMGDVDCSFYLIRGHQTRPTEFSAGYYNMLADREASSGRLFGEMLLKSAYATMKNSLGYPQIKITPHPNTQIVAPAQISFHYEELVKNPKLVSRYAKHKKENTFRRANQNASRGRHG